MRKKPAKRKKRSRGKTFALRAVVLITACLASVLVAINSGEIVPLHLVMQRVMESLGEAAISLFDS